MAEIPGPYNGLPDIEGTALVVVREAKVERKEKRDGSGSYDTNVIKAVICLQKDGTKHLAEHEFNKMSPEGDYFRSMIGQPMLCTLSRNDRNWIEIRSVGTLQELNDLAKDIKKVSA
jgi:hypothetical protein